MKKFRQFKQVEQKEEKKSKVGLYMAIAIAVVMIGGVAGIFLSNPTSGSNQAYGNYEFKNVNNQWVTKINGQSINFYFLPDQVRSFQVSNESIEKIRDSQAILLSSDPTENSTSRLQAIDIFRFEFASSYSTLFNRQVGSGVTKIINNSKLPYLNCDNSTIMIPVFVVGYSNESDVKLNGNCITAEAVDEYSLLGLLDNIRYRLYGVLQ